MADLLRDQALHSLHCGSCPRFKKVSAVKRRPGAEKAVQAHQEERGRSPGLSPGAADILPPKTNHADRHFSDLQAGSIGHCWSVHSDKLSPHLVC